MTPLTTTPAAPTPATPRFGGGLTGAGFTKDSGGSRIDGFRVLDRYKSAYDAGNKGVAEGLLRSLGREDLLTDGWWNEYTDESDGALRGTIHSEISPEAQAVLDQYQIARIGRGKNRQFVAVDPKTNQLVYAADPFRYTKWSEAPLEALSVLSTAALPGIPGLGAALGGAMGASGLGASVLGNGLISGGLSAAGGGDFLKGALGGALGAGVAPLASGLSASLGGGMLGGAASGALSSLARGVASGNLDMRSLLAGAAGGGAGAGVSDYFGGGDFGKFAGQLAGRTAGGLVGGRSGGDALRTALMGAFPSAGGLLTNSFMGGSGAEPTFESGFFDPDGAGYAGGSGKEQAMDFGDFGGGDYDFGAGYGFGSGDPSGGGFDLSGYDFGGGQEGFDLSQLFGGSTGGGGGGFDLSALGLSGGLSGLSGGFEGGAEAYMDQNPNAFGVGSEFFGADWLDSLGGSAGGGGAGGSGALGALSGLLGKGGDWLSKVFGGDPAALRQANSAVGVLGLLNALKQNTSGKGGGAAGIDALRGMMPAQAQSDANKAAQSKLFTSPLTQPQVASGASALRRYGVDPMAPQYARGGDVHTGDRGALNRIAEDFSAMGGGQDDVIDAKLAEGEYVFDSDVVSALGDGSNDAGARKLDEFREAIRRHKRAAPASQIPPRAKPITQYLK
jgi:hypothetical protein